MGFSGKEGQETITGEGDAQAGALGLGPGVAGEWSLKNTLERRTRQGSWMVGRACKEYRDDLDFLEIPSWESYQNGIVSSVFQTDHDHKDKGNVNDGDRGGRQTS